MEDMLTMFQGFAFLNALMDLTETLQHATASDTAPGDGLHIQLQTCVFLIVQLHTLLIILPGDAS